MYACLARFLNKEEKTLLQALMPAEFMDTVTLISLLDLPIRSGVCEMLLFSS